MLEMQLYPYLINLASFAETKRFCSVFLAP